MASDNDVMSLLALADLSIANGDYDRSVLILKGALAQADKTAPNDVKLRLDILMKLADVNHITGQWVDALMYLDTVLQTASEKNLTGVMGEALIASGTILSKKGKWDIANRKFEQAMSMLGHRSQHPLMAKAAIGKGTILWRRGMGDDAILAARKAYAIAEGLEDDDIMGAAQALIASATFDSGSYEQSLAASEKAIGHFKRSGNHIELSRVLNNMGETHKVMGRYEKAIEAFNEGLKHTTGKGVRRNMGYLLTNLAECHIRGGRNLEARTFVTMAEDNIAGIQDEYLHAMHRFVWGLIFEHEKDLGKASENYMAALLKMMSLGIPFDIGLIEVAYSQCLRKQGKNDDAARHLRDAAASFRKTGAKAMAEKAEALLAGLS